MEPNTKLCAKCRIVKSTEDFSKNKKSKDGLQAWCKSCQNSYYETNRETILANAHAYIKENHAEILANKKRYRQSHPEEIAQGRKRFRAANRDRLIENDRLYYETNKDRILEQNKQYRDENPELLLLRNARLRSKEKQVPFSLKREDILVPEICPVLGLVLETGEGRLHDGSPTLDRRTPKLGYVKDNVAVISHRANTIKSNGTAAEHRLVADWLDGKSDIKFNLRIPDKKHSKMLVDHARKRSAKRRVPFNLKQRDILIPDICPILGIPLQRGIGKMQESSPTIDRKIPEKGYTRDNIAVISLRANQIKSHGTADEHRRIADWMDSWPNRPNNGQNNLP